MTIMTTNMAVRAGFSYAWVEWDGVEGRDGSAGVVRVDGQVVPATITECDLAKNLPHNPNHVRCTTYVGTIAGFTFAFELPNGLVAVCVADDSDSPVYLWGNYDLGIPVTISAGIATVSRECQGFECVGCHHRATVASFETYDDLMRLLNEWSVLSVVR